MCAGTGNEAYVIAEGVLDRIRQSLRVPETGGILGVNENRLVTEFHFDNTGVTTKRIYVPDTESLNEVIREWSLRGIEFAGFVHAHPPNKKTLSVVDIRYAEKIKRHCALSEILMLLYLPADDSFHQYVL